MAKTNKWFARLKHIHKHNKISSTSIYINLWAKLNAYQRRSTSDNMRRMPYQRPSHIIALWPFVCFFYFFTKILQSLSFKKQVLNVVTLKWVYVAKKECLYEAYHDMIHSYRSIAFVCCNLAVCNCVNKMKIAKNSVIMRQWASAWWRLVRVNQRSLFVVVEGGLEGFIL